jgi:hypothetical protein
LFKYTRGHKPLKLSFKTENVHLQHGQTMNSWKGDIFLGSFHALPMQDWYQNAIEDLIAVDSPGKERKPHANRNGKQGRNLVCGRWNCMAALHTHSHTHSYCTPSGLSIKERSKLAKGLEVVASKKKILGPVKVGAFIPPNSSYLGLQYLNKVRLRLRLHHYICLRGHLSGSLEKSL